MLQKLSQFSIIGNPDSFSIEERIFNTFCVIAMIAMTIEIPFNYFIGLIETVWVCSLSVVVSFGLYYLSRIRRRFDIAVYLFGISANSVFVINYFFNSGLRGPSLLLFAIALLLTIVIIPKRQFLWWIAANLAIVFSLIAYEYYHPKVIPYAYEDDASLFLDHAVTYLVMAILLYYTINYVRTNHDTERKKVQLQNLQISAQNEALEKINSEKNKLFSIVSHDIKAPLSSIQAYLEMLTEVNLSEKDRFEVKRRLLRLTKETSQMISNLLIWSKGQLDKTHIEFKNINVHQLFSTSFNVEKDFAAKKLIIFNARCKEDLVVYADEERLQIIIRNLLNNAVKFTNEGGEIWLTARREADRCLIKVGDNGRGISEEFRGSLFQLKANSTYGTNNEKGVGLGLVLCKELAELLNGDLRYEQNEGAGSVFILTLPLGS